MFLNYFANDKFFFLIQKLNVVLNRIVINLNSPNYNNTTNTSMTL